MTFIINNRVYTIVQTHNVDFICVSVYIYVYNPYSELRLFDNKIPSHGILL